MPESCLARGRQLLAGIKFRGNIRQEGIRVMLLVMSLKQLLGWGLFLAPLPSLSFTVLEGMGKEHGIGSNRKWE